MAHLIDKDAVLAEIERRKQDAINNCGGFKSMREHECNSCIVEQYEEMKNIINTLEVKEVDLENLREELDKAVKIYKPNGDFGWGTLYNIAVHFFELGMQQSKNYNNNGE